MFSFYRAVLLYFILLPVYVAGVLDRDFDLIDHIWVQFIVSTW